MRLILTSIFMTALSLPVFQPALAHHRAVPFTSNHHPLSAPARVSDLSCVRKEDRVQLAWTLENNAAADRLIVQRSSNGKKFEMAGLVFSSEKESMDEYRFAEPARKKKTYYRIIIVNKDQTVSYSTVVRMASEKKSGS